MAQTTTDKAFAQLIAELEARDIPYRVIGGIATRSFLEQYKISIARRSLRIEVDLIVPRNKISEVERLAHQIGFGNHDMAVDLFAAKRHIDFRPDEEYSYLVHRRLKVPIPTTLFASHRIMAHNVKADSLDPLILFHTYVVCGGVLRKKDRKTVFTLARLIRDSGSSRCAEGDVILFHSFLKDRNRIYPEYVKAVWLSNWLKDRLPELLKRYATYLGTIIQDKLLGV